MPEQPDTELGDFQLLPADDPDFDAASELDGAFVDPEGDPLIDAEFAPPAPIPYGKSWQFDLAKRRFVHYGQRPVEIFGKDSLKQWIEFVLQIQAGAHSILPDDYGMRDPFLLIGQVYSPALEAEYQDDIINALTVHDRIEQVTDFRFEHDEDETIVNCSFLVITDDGEDIRINTAGEVAPVA